jgi:hypothetical protein
MDNVQKHNICIKTHAIDILIWEFGVKENLKNGDDIQAFPQTGGRIQNDDHERMKISEKSWEKHVYTSIQ